MNALIILWSSLKGWWHRRSITWIQCVITLALLPLFLKTSDLLPPDYFRRRLSEQVGGLRFNFVAWEWKAAISKLGSEFAAQQDTLSEAQRQQLVVDYLEGVRNANALRREISDIYSQFDKSEVASRAKPKEEELTRLRSWLRARQNLVEGILEEQVSTELEAEGFGRWGYVWPPVKFHFTELPLLLVISSRAQITREIDVHLEVGIPLQDQEKLEKRVDQRFDTMRSLVTPIGGLSAYPAMVLEYDSLIWLSDTFAHEWAHDLLIFYPLGYNYDQSGEMTSLNETTASIVGREIGRRVILRYYPELGEQLPPLPTPPDVPPMSAGELVWPDEPPPDQFDFNREMRETRLRVDELLSEGQIREAEALMEERRLFLAEHGYNIRKLNQAYFAFHGSYATSPSVVNPIGGQLEWLRAQSFSLRDYVRTMALLSQYEELLPLLAQEQPTVREQGATRP